MAGLSWFTVDNNTAVLSILLFSTSGLVYVLDPLAIKGLDRPLLNVQGSPAAVVHNSSLSRAEETRVCVSVSSKLLLGLVIDVFLIVE